MQRLHLVWRLNMSNQYKSHDEALKAFNVQQDSFYERFSETVHSGVRKAFAILTKQQCLPCDECNAVLHDQIKSRAVRIAPEEQPLVIAVFEMLLPAIRNACTNADKVIYPIKRLRMTDKGQCELASIYAATFVENLHVIEARYRPAFMKALNGVCLECVVHQRIESLKISTRTTAPVHEGGLFWEILRASVFEHIKHDDELSILLNPLNTDLLLTYLVNR